MNIRHVSNVRKKLLITIALCVVILTFLIIGAVAVSGPDKYLKIKGEPVLTTEYGETFSDPGAEAFIDGQKAEVEVTGRVDCDRLGEYQLVYRIRGYRRPVIKRTVQVKDTKAPVITLNCITGQVTMPGEDYREEGFTAVDNYDGDVTGQVRRQVEKDKVIYTVTDSSGNQATEIRPIFYGDSIAPVITLRGAKEIKISAGEEFTDPGFTAADNIDGDVTAGVVVAGTVNTTTAGTYTITYTVTDSHGNKAEMNRTVIVEPIRQPEYVEPDGKVIYLTFDDGPGKYTEKLLGILKKYNVKATFFVIDSGYNHEMKRITEEGHAIGIHTKTHDYKKLYASDEAFFQDFYAIRDIIHKNTGIWTTLSRFPGGGSNTISAKYCKGIMTRLTKAVTDMGYQYFDWNVDSDDAGRARTPDEVFNNVIKGIGNRKTAVVLQHDIKEYSVDAVERIIIWGLQHGYSFQALTPGSPTCHHRVNN